MLSRRAFFENAHTLCAAQARRKEPVAMLMFDLDHFKSINDRFGHAVGDEVLRVFGQVVCASTRADDIRPIRRRRIHRNRSGRRRERKQDRRTRPSGFQAAGATVAAHAIDATVSIGATVCYEPVTAIDALISRTEAALYRAKHGGRNRVHIADEEAASDRSRLINAARRAREIPSGAFPGLSQRNTTA
ncbi:MAG: GGDEF domain-containing protein [Pseudolabrys sp.]